MSITASEQLIRSLYQITSAYQQGFDEQLKMLLKLGCERFKVEVGILAKVERQTYEVIQCLHPSDIPLSPGDHFGLCDTFCVETLKAKGPTGFHHIAHSPIRTHPAYKALHLEAYLGTPVLVNGSVYGTLNFSSPTPKERAFSAVDIDALQLMAIWVGGELARQVTQHQLELSNQALRYSQQQLELANQQLRELALVDPLTGIPNRRQLDHQLTQQLALANRQQQNLSLVMIDLDDFKHINDHYGHQTGDQVLRHCAQLLQGQLRPSDLLARFGGEEFTLLLPDTDQHQAQDIAERLRHKLHTTPCDALTISASFGVYTHCGKNAQPDDCAHLLRGSDHALYCAKTRGKNRVEHFSSCPTQTCTASNPQQVTMPD